MRECLDVTWTYAIVIGGFSQGFGWAVIVCFKHGRFFGRYENSYWVFMLFDPNEISWQAFILVWDFLMRFHVFWPLRDFLSRFYAFWPLRDFLLRFKLYVPYGIFLMRLYAFGTTVVVWDSLLKFCAFYLRKFLWDCREEVVQKHAWEWVREKRGLMEYVEKGRRAFWPLWDILMRFDAFWLQNWRGWLGRRGWQNICDVIICLPFLPLRDSLMRFFVRFPNEIFTAYFSDGRFLNEIS